MLYITMLPNCLILFLLGSFIEASDFLYSDSTNRLQPCPYPKIEHGRARIKQRTRLVKFMCASRYELVGNRYATCRNGQWDVPIPVCVKAGCDPLPNDTNSIQVREHRDAWVVTFCLPGYKLVGSSAVYCDGFKWNDTAPICVDSTVKPSLSCDFEEPSICGWTDDELHDFDWTRWNKRTPSSFLLTGPSYDHTYGSQKQGYYMYIESTSRPENGSARLLSPIYDSSLTTIGCFQFFYHMYGRDIGGLRVYQKPDSLQLLDMLNDNVQKHLLFEQWGNQGNFWYSATLELTPMNEDFQIVIEGVRGSSFISDIAIDDVAILQGNNCSLARQNANNPTTTPSIEMQTCAGRCNKKSPNPLLCGCAFQCLIYRDCCPDFLDTCYLDDDAISSTDDLPETQKLVGETTVNFPSLAVSQTATVTSKPLTTTTTPTTTSTTTTTTTTTTKKPTTTKPTTTKPTTTKPTTTKRTTTKRTATKRTTIKATTIKPTTKTTSKVTTRFVPTTKPTKRVVTTQKVPTTIAAVNINDSFIDKKKEEAEVNLNKLVSEDLPKQSNSSTWKTAIITIVVIALSVALIYVAVTAKTARGRFSIARVRGRLSHDSEVRYLNSATDDDL